MSKQQTKQRYVIIGASAAGLTAARTLSHIDPASEIVCISNQNENPYNTCLLVDCLSQKRELKSIYLSVPVYNLEKNIFFRLGLLVNEIDLVKKKVFCSDDSEILYDKLLIATGSSPIVSQINVINSINGVFAFHRVSDLQLITSYVHTYGVKKAVIIGAGLTGLECADALLSLGIEPTVIEKSNRVLSGVIDFEGSLFLQGLMEKKGIHFLSNESVKSYMQRSGRISGVVTVNNVLLKTDMIINAIGTKPNVALAVNFNIKHDSQGIFVDEYLQTNQPDIYAAGDVVQTKNRITKQLTRTTTWSDAMEQGMYAAWSMAQKNREYPGLVGIVTTSFFGLSFASTGSVNVPSSDYAYVYRQGPDFYHRFFNQEMVVKGFILIGNGSILGSARKAFLAGLALNF